MTSASHAEGRQFDPGQVYQQRRPHASVRGIWRGWPQPASRVQNRVSRGLSRDAVVAVSDGGCFCACPRPHHRAMMRQLVSGGSTCSTAHARAANSKPPRQQTWRRTRMFARRRRCSVLVCGSGSPSEKRDSYKSARLPTSSVFVRSAIV